MNIELITVGPFEVNCAVVRGTEKEAFVIDPGSNAADIDAVLKKNGLSVTAYLLTHGHVDHIHALAELHRTHPAPVCIHAEDLSWAFEEPNQFLPYYSVPEKPDAEFIHPESSGLWKNSGMRFQTLETPGHTPGGVCFYFAEEKILFSGDTLFKGSCGRTDLPGGDGRVLAQSLKKLTVLPDDVKVYAGHGAATTIGHEKRTNFFMQQSGG